jgi:hypothetical protein
MSQAGSNGSGGSGGSGIETLSSEGGAKTSPSGNNFNFSGSTSGGAAANGAILFNTSATGEMDAAVQVDGTTIEINGSNKLAVVNPSALVLIGTTIASGSGHVDFLLPSTYKTYYVIGYNINPSVDGDVLHILQSQNSGSTFLGSPDYNGTINYSYFGNTTTNNLNSLAFFIVTGPMENAGAGSSAQLMFTLCNSNTANALTLRGECYYSDHNFSGSAQGDFSGLGATGINFIRFVCSTGNISSGTFSLYGVVT